MISAYLPIENGRYGFSIENSRPTKLTAVSKTAHKAGLKDGYQLTAIDGENVEKSDHLEVVNRIQKNLEKGKAVFVTVKCPVSSNDDMFISKTKSPKSPYRNFAKFNSFVAATNQKLFRKNKIAANTPNKALRKCRRICFNHNVCPNPSGEKMKKGKFAKDLKESFVQRRSSLYCLDGLPSPKRLGKEHLQAFRNRQHSDKLMSLMSHQRPFYEGKKGIKERDVILAQFVANFLGIYKIRSEYDSGNLISDATSLIYEQVNGTFQWNSTTENFCQIKMHAEKVVIQLAKQSESDVEFPLGFEIPKHLIVAIDRVGGDDQQDIFGIFLLPEQHGTDKTDPNKSPALDQIVCCIFQPVSSEFRRHSNHLLFAESNGIQCRKNLISFEQSFSTSESTFCFQFPSRSIEIIWVLRHLLASNSPPAQASKLSLFSTTSKCNFIAADANQNSEQDRVVNNFMMNMTVRTQGPFILDENNSQITDERPAKFENDQDRLIFDENQYAKSIDAVSQPSEAMNTEFDRPSCWENRAPENKHESNSAGRNLNSLLTNSKRARLLSFLNAQPRNIGRQTKVRKKGHKSLVGSFKFDRFILSSPTLIKYPVQKSEALLLNGILHKQGDLSSESLAGKQPESTTSVTSFRRTSKRGSRFLAKDEHNSEESECAFQPPRQKSIPIVIEPTSIAIDKGKENRQPILASSATNIVDSHFPDYRQQLHQTAAIDPNKQHMSGAATAIQSSSSSEQPQQLCCDLEEILQSETARAPFLLFLQQQYCAENIDFYLAVQEYKKIPDNEREKRTKYGRQIYDRFFDTRSTQAINVDSSSSNHIKNAYMLNQFTSEVFDIVQYQIFHLLKYDCWPRFLRSAGQIAEELGGSERSHTGSPSTSRVYDSATGLYPTSQCEEGKRAGSRRKSLFRRFLSRQRDQENLAEGAKDIAPQARCSSRRSLDYQCLCDCHLSESTKTVPAIAHSYESHKNDIGTVSDTNNLTLNYRFTKSNEDNQLFNYAEAGGNHFKKKGGSFNRPRPTKMRHCGCCSHKYGDGGINRHPDTPVRYCQLVCADSPTPKDIPLTNQLESVRQWVRGMAESCGLDRNSVEVVDAQTSSTIDPARQAVDALNNREVRIMPVVRFPVVFLAPTPPTFTGSLKATPPLPAKVVVLRCRLALTIGKVLKHIMFKCNAEADDAVVCIAGTQEQVRMQTPVSAVCQKILVVMTERQFEERKTLLHKRDYQKEVSIVPQSILHVCGPNPTSTNELSIPTFHQHGDVGFCDLPIELDTSRVGGLLKHTAQRTYSSNPRDIFKFGRKQSQAKGSNRMSAAKSDGPNEIGEGSPVEIASPGSSTHLRYRKSGGSTGHGSSGSAKDIDRRKSFGASAITTEPSADNCGSSAETEAQVAGGTRRGNTSLSITPSDIPYCGEIDPPVVSEICATYSVSSTIVRHEPLSTSPGVQRGFNISNNPDLTNTVTSCSLSSTNTPTIRQPHHQSPIPLLYTSIVSDKESLTPQDVIESGLAWQKADYV